MTTDSQATAPETTEVPASTDTTAAPQGETAQSTPASPQDWERRYKAAQAELTRQAQARAKAERELSELQAAADEPDEDEQEATPRKRASRSSADAELWQQRALEAEWVNAQSIYGEDIIGAYTAAAELLDRAQTPADYVGAFEAYHQARLEGATPAAAAQRTSPPAQAQAVLPRADSNRSDAPPDLTKQIEEAKRSGDLMAFVKAKLAGG